MQPVFRHILPFFFSFAPKVFMLRPSCSLPQLPSRTLATNNRSLLPLLSFAFRANGYSVFPIKLWIALSWRTTSLTTTDLITNRYSLGLSLSSFSIKVRPNGKTSRRKSPSSCRGAERKKERNTLSASQNANSKATNSFYSSSCSSYDCLSR